MRLFLLTTIAMLLLLTLVTCKKEKEITVKNVIYVFTVIDEITKEPVDSCIVLLEMDLVAGAVGIDTLGMTNEDGEFIYEYDIKPYGVTGGGAQVIYFVKNGYCGYLSGCSGKSNFVTLTRVENLYIQLHTIELTPEQ
jgi:hypothetical protein